MSKTEQKTTSPETSNAEASPKENTATHLRNLLQIQNSWGRWFFMGLTSVILCTLGPLSIFAPFPLLSVFLLYGRLKGHILGLGILLLLVAFSAQLDRSHLIMGIFLMNFLFAALLAEIILRQEHPITGLLKAGGGIVLIVAAIFTMIYLSSDFSLEKYLSTAISEKLTQFKTENAKLLEESGEEAAVLKDLLDKPERLVADVIPWLPSMAFATIFIYLWINLFMALQNIRAWRFFTPYKYALKELVYFKVNEYLVWPLIAGLGLVLAGEHFVGKLGMAFGQNLLTGLSVFYFLQGFGVLLDFLTHVKIFGFMRSLFTVFTIYLEWRIVVIIGVFDLWFDFRKFLKKNDKEGDSL